MAGIETIAMRLLIGGDSRGAQKALKDVGLSAKDTTGQMDKSSQRLGEIGNKMSGVGSKMTKGITVPVMAVAGASAVMAAKFQASMTLIQTQAGGSAKDVKYLSKAILGMKDVQHSPEQLAAAMYHLKSVGMDNVQAMDALTASEHLANVGGSDLETTTNAVASAYKSGIEGAQNFNQAAATINATIGAGNLRLEDYVSAMGTGIMVNAKQAGVSLTDVGAAIATMTSRGIPAVRAATSLKMAFSAMAAPTDKMSKVLKDIGLKEFDLANAMRKGGLPAAVQLLKDHLQGLSKTAQSADLTKMFGAKSSQAILTLIANTEDYAKVQNQITDNATSGKFQEAIAAQAEDATAKWHKFTASMAQAGAAFGTKLLPILTKVGGALAKMGTWLASLPGSVKTVIVSVALLAAAIGPLLVVTGKTLTGIQAIRNFTFKRQLAKGVGDVLGKGGGGGVLGGAEDVALKAAISLNTTATEANTLALAKGGLPGGGGPGGGGVGTTAKKLAPYAPGVLGAGLTAAGTGIGAAAVLIAPTVIADTLGKNSKAHQEFLAAGAEAGKAFATTGFGKGSQAALILAGNKMNNTAAAAGSRLVASLRASGDKAGSGLAAGLARGVGPALQSIQRVRTSAGRPIHMGNLDATQMINEIARVSRALGGVSSAARTAGNAAANAIKSPSGGGGSYRGHFMAAGGDFMVRRPTLFVAGEAGPERATFTPQGKKAPGGGSGDTHFHFHVGQIVGTDERAARQFWNLVKPIAMSDMRMKMAMSRG